MTGEPSGSDSFLSQALRDTVKPALAVMRQQEGGDDLDFLPLETSALSRSLQPPPSSFPVARHFTLTAAAASWDWSLKRPAAAAGAEGGAGDGIRAGAKRPRPSEGGEEEGELAVSSRVAAVVADHRNKLTPAICAAIERALDVGEGGAAAAGGAGEEKYKVHEAIAGGIKESIFIVLNLATGAWKKTRKTKKVASA